MYNNQHHQFDTQYNHKLFFHANRWGNDVISAIKDLRPKVIKFLDPNFDNVKRVRELVPDALLIYRRWVANQHLGDSEGEAYEIGLTFAWQISEERVIKDGLVDLVEGYNERVGETAPADEHRKYANFQIGFSDGLDDTNVEPIAFNFGTGNMTAELILKHYGEVLNYYDWLGFHEYDCPTMDRLHNQGLAEGNGGQWLALRYRRIMQPIIKELGNKWSVVITECGMTQGVLGGEDVGFSHPVNTTPGIWSGYPAPIPPDDYWQTLQWYNSELMKDDYVAGACLFVTGGISPWESFEVIGSITPKIKAYQKEIEDNDMALTILTQEELAKIESYRPPFLAQGVTDIFVDDLRGDDDPSLGAVPRITTYEQLKGIFKLDVDQTLGWQSAGNGQLYWRVVGFYMRTGAAAFIPKVLDINGQPPDPHVVVFAHWPGAPNFPADVNPPYHSNAVGGFTNDNGDIGFGYSGGAVTGENGGVYSIWVSSDPPTGTRFHSDAAIKLGWWGSTDHLTPNPIIMVVRKGNVTQPPPTGDNRLVIYQGGTVRYVPLVSGPGNMERIALEIGGAEVAYVETRQA